MNDLDIEVDIDDALKAHRSRDIGTRGFREVTLAVFTDGVRMSTYRICHIWTVSNEECRSLYLLTEPTALAGTVVLLTETPSGPTTDIWLRLKTARRPLHVDNSRSAQFVLGTDFTYEDLRFWLPMGGTKGLKIHRLADKVHVTLSTEREGDHGWSTSRVAFHIPSWLPAEIVYFERSGVAFKVYEARGITRVQGIWTPIEMSITRENGQYKSVMTLQTLTYGVDISPDCFDIRSFRSPDKYPIARWRDNAVRIAPTA